MTYQVLANIGNNWDSHTLLVRKQNGAATLENNWAVFTQLNIQLPYDLAIPHLVIYCGELKMYNYTSIKK